MQTGSTLASRFGRNSHIFRSNCPLGEAQMRTTAPSIFAEGKHDSRSERYTYIPTIEVLRALHHEGFEPFMVAQSASRIAGKSEFTKHMIRMRHAGQVQAKSEAHEIILINSHDGASSYQMLAGVFRFVCCNGLVVGDIANDIRIPHKGRIQDQVIDGAFRVLQDFEAVESSTQEMKALPLSRDEQLAFAEAALTLRYGDAEIAQAGGEQANSVPPAPITATQLLQARRQEDEEGSLWMTFQRTQEHLIQGGLPGRSIQGRRVRTRAVESIDRSVGLNRALWVLAEEMRKLKRS
ncbi:DUF932 domain-containing protein [Paucibacter sp. B51]|uniref:DUF932 domain-containing protein n=1 Tax=Paucibacter sp. B51 TaxID=2993315 RepID=UPI0022EC15D2|nr:DUF932 domain-containing protein [Paucibacter sp. B51]